MDVWEATSTTSMDVEKVGLKISLGLKIRGEKRKKGGGKEERKKGEKEEKKKKKKKEKKREEEEEEEKEEEEAVRQMKMKKKIKEEMKRAMLIGKQRLSFLIFSPPSDKNIFEKQDER